MNDIKKFENFNTDIVNDMDDIKINAFLKLFFDGVLSNNEFEDILKVLGINVILFQRGYGKYTLRVKVNDELKEFSGDLSKK